MNPGAPELLGFWFFQPDTVSSQDRTPQGLEKPEAFFFAIPHTPQPQQGTSDTQGTVRNTPKQTDKPWENRLFVCPSRCFYLPLQRFGFVPFRSEENDEKGIRWKSWTDPLLWVPAKTSPLGNILLPLSAATCGREGRPVQDGTSQKTCQDKHTFDSFRVYEAANTQRSRLVLFPFFPHRECSFFLVRCPRPPAARNRQGKETWSYTYYILQYCCWPRYAPPPQGHKPTRAHTTPPSAWKA